MLPDECSHVYLSKTTICVSVGDHFWLLEVDSELVLEETLRNRIGISEFCLNHKLIGLIIVTSDFPWNFLRCQIIKVIKGWLKLNIKEGAVNKVKTLQESDFVLPNWFWILFRRVSNYY